MLAPRRSAHRGLRPSVAEFDQRCYQPQSPTYEREIVTCMACVVVVYAALELFDISVPPSPIQRRTSAALQVLLMLLWSNQFPVSRKGTRKKDRILLSSYNSVSREPGSHDESINNLLQERIQHVGIQTETLAVGCTNGAPSTVVDEGYVHKRRLGEPCGPTRS